MYKFFKCNNVKCNIRQYVKFKVSFKLQVYGKMCMVCLFKQVSIGGNGLGLKKGGFLVKNNSFKFFFVRKFFFFFFSMF